MSYYSKVTLVIDSSDWENFKSLVDAVPYKHYELSYDTPDNDYKFIVWEYVQWDGPEVKALMDSLGNIRHTIGIMSEDGNIQIVPKLWDERGSDGVFDEILSWTGDFCVWGEDAPLSPVKLAHPYINGKQFVPISRERALQILAKYIENELSSAETAVIYDALTKAGASNEEIRALGYGYVLPEEKNA